MKVTEEDQQKAREIASQIASHYLQAGPEHVAMTLTMQGPIETALTEARAETWKAAIEDLHKRQVRCIRNCVPNNAPLNTVLTYLDDAKRDAIRAAAGKEVDNATKV
jgi:hypothetical protein